jgi:excisionase family DNA binding protein
MVSASKNIFESLWAPRDAAAYLRIHEKTVIKMARLRQLPALRLGKHWRFRRDDLVTWAASQVQSTCQPAE